jgi:hypothetical protein
VKPNANGAGCHALAANQHQDAAPIAPRPRKHVTHQQSTATTVSCAVVGHGGIRATADQLPALRQNPGSYPARPIPPGFLKHADEQTVVAMAALLKAIERDNLTDVDFTDWGVLAAPRFLGRITTSQALERFAAEGAWGISPHLIPHRTLHAISGTISQAMQIHGPNLGVGGGPDAALEVTRVAAAFLANHELPGLWLIMSGWDSEPVSPQIEDRGSKIVDGRRTLDPRSSILNLRSFCQAVALALTPIPQDWNGMRMEFRFGVPGSNGHKPSPVPPMFSLESLLMALDEHPGTQEGSQRGGRSWSLSNGGWVDLKLVGAGAERKL